jgi:hypothetical protein
MNLIRSMADMTDDTPMPPRSQSAVKDGKVRLEGHKLTLNPTTGTQKPKTSINGNPLSPTIGTHIDVYHGDTHLDGCSVTPAPK